LMWEIEGSSFSHFLKRVFSGSKESLPATI
jgi:hypothetical protein